MVKTLKKYCHFILIILLIAVGIGIYNYQNKQGSNTILIDRQAGFPYKGNIIQETEKNSYFRKVIFTGTRSQLVVMNIPPGGKVGEETHKYTEQTLFFLSGTGKAILDGKEKSINAGDVVVVTPGTKHNFVNTGIIPLKIYTVYSPPNHIDGRIHITKEDADKDLKDESFGDKTK